LVKTTLKTVAEERFPEHFGNSARLALRSPRENLLLPMQSNCTAKIFSVTPRLGECQEFQGSQNQTGFEDVA
jgi:hypothetical protein